jgi:hypothetical protein
MTYFFRRKFSLPEGELGTIFFVTSSIAAASTLVASSIAKRIGNVKVNPQPSILDPHFEIFEFTAK